MDYQWPDDIDRHLNWHPGTAERLARRGRLPHYKLPDGSIRFRVEEIQPLIRRVTPPPLCIKCRIPIEKPAASGLCVRCRTGAVNAT